MIRLLVVLIVFSGVGFTKDLNVSDLAKNVGSYQALLQDKLSELENAKNEESQKKTDESGAFDTSFLLASILWGSVGMGYFMYGKKSQKPIALIGGLVLTAASYFCGPILMSVVGIVVMVGVYQTHQW